MLSASSVSKHTEDVLEDVLRTIREEFEGPYCVLCETDRKNYVEEEDSLRKQLKEAKESESNCSSFKLRGLLGLPSSPMSKCLKDAQELLQRVKEDINSKMRTRLTGKSNLPPPSIHGQGSARVPEQDGGHPLAEGNSEPDSALITSPLNMRCSFSGASDVDVSVNPPVRNETVNETSDRNSSGRRHRRSPPSPPLRQKVLSSNSRLLPETWSDSGSDSPRRSSVRRPAPLPPQSPSNSRPLSEASSGSGSDSPRRSPSVRRPAPPPPQSPSDSRPVSAISSDSGSDSPRRSPSVRRPAPPPPQSPSNSRPLSEASSGSGSDSPRRSPSVRRPAPPPPQSPSNSRPVSAILSDSGSDSPRRFPSVRRSPPSPLHSSRQSRTPRSPGNASFLSTSPGSPPLDPAMMSMITQQLSTLASSLATGSSRGSNRWHVIKENCLEISGSNVDGVTMNNDSNNCSGADDDASTYASTSSTVLGSGYLSRAPSTYL
ncbi:hypothetical protein JVT61DRAFT_3228 [Boletus reticuloceps]|uniref:Uncharacterized protein n=1 Tax=Boletus reticuloceps TaxID=495285 RepID=A0A8I2YPU3_9AGAM|nr:hypothetical protein JVT61DRAFT_3228 [Boletus reticuloceps]